MYVFAGLMKIDRDWLRLEPLREWLAGNAELPLIGPLLLNHAVVAAAAYGSITLHLLGAPLLLFKPTRLWTFLAYCVFNGLNALFWDIGIFPWFTIVATLLFPGWPRSLLGQLRRAPARMQPLQLPATPGSSPIMRAAISSFVGDWIALQVAVPLRTSPIRGS
jgi:vitamin K-dependent gamma-carboxylase